VAARSNRLRTKAGYALAVAGDVTLRAGRRLTATSSGETLEGDRWIEWSFCAARLSDDAPTTLDFGADIGFLSLSAAQRGSEVVALSIEELPPIAEHPRITQHQGDILDRPLAGRRFAQIVNCSSVEHVGLAGRYDNADVTDGDLRAMEILADMLEQGGRMILTIPVGRDMVCAPQHRIYGTERLPRLIAPYELVEEQYWHKSGGRWVEATRAEALAVEGSESFYALGLFVLKREP
jgi:Caenorhabditis protein of unknown function, DUF268